MHRRAKVDLFRPFLGRKLNVLHAHKGISAQREILEEDRISMHRRAEVGLFRPSLGAKFEFSYMSVREFLQEEIF